MFNILNAHDIVFFPVCSYGRSGTSLLMNLLSNIDVAVFPPLPFEDRSIQVMFLHELSKQTGVTAGSATRPEVAAARGFGIEYFSKIGAGSKEVAELTERLSSYVTGCKNAGKLGIAEKLIGFQMLRTMKSFDDSNRVRPIFLIRDPRDIFISVKDFNKKRGFSGFNDINDDTRLFRIICNFEKDQIRLSERMTGYVCYYEDFIARRDRTMVGLINHLGIKSVSAERIESVWQGVKADLPEAKRHMTSETAQDSVKKWSAPEALPYRELFTKESQLIQQLGYPV